MKRLKPILVVSPNINYASMVMSEKGYRRRHWKYVVDAIDTMGFRDAVVVMVGNWQDKPGIATILSSVNAKNTYTKIDEQDLPEFHEALFGKNTIFIRECVG